MVCGTLIWILMCLGKLSTLMLLLAAFVKLKLETGVMTVPGLLLDLDVVRNGLLCKLVICVLMTSESVPFVKD